MDTFFISCGPDSSLDTPLFDAYWQEAARQCSNRGLVPLLKVDGITGRYHIEGEGTSLDVHVYTLVGDQTIYVEMRRWRKKPLNAIQRRWGAIQGGLEDVPYEHTAQYAEAFLAARNIYEQMRVSTGDLPDWQYGITLNIAGHVNSMPDSEEN